MRGKESEREVREEEGEERGKRRDKGERKGRGLIGCLECITLSRSSVCDRDVKSQITQLAKTLTSQPFSFRNYHTED